MSVTQEGRIILAYMLARTFSRCGATGHPSRECTNPMSRGKIRLNYQENDYELVANLQGVLDLEGDTEHGHKDSIPTQNEKVTETVTLTQLVQMFNMK
ncbi:hypothetical protein CHS0354_000260 [Potamilus streckersoni]|uniref:CCHC-type domain-containing protein n=1 Tax=Potamilus streckersoni TaxID=2493646 RepID=A0AAE0SMI1_9BIVA|nr:hypothetical protein CHS0354_000260 [Potamilus streckersoni]